jgi:hypothetical protein
VGSAVNVGLDSAPASADTVAIMDDMSYGRRPRKKTPAPEETRPPPAAALMQDHFEAKPYSGHHDGGVVGEFVVGKPEPPRALPQPFRPPPPDWDAEAREEKARERVAEEARAEQVLAGKAKREEGQE